MNNPLTRKPPFEGCWWLSPLALILCVHVPICLGSYLIPAETYGELWKVTKYIDEGTLMLTLGAMLAFVIGYVLNGMLIGDHKSRRVKLFEVTPSRRDLLQLLFKISLGLTLFGMSAWFGVAIKRGLRFSYVLSFLRQEGAASSALRHEFFKTIPGITTNTQFGMAAVIIGTCAYLLTGRKMLLRAVFAIVALDIVRGFLLSERLALIEVVIPVAILWIQLKISLNNPSPQMRLILRLGPVLGIVGLYLLFTVSEAFRSWTFYSKGGGSLFSFGALRLIGYYSTALNNSALLLKAIDTPQLPYLTQEWLWKLPLMGELGGSTAKIMTDQYSAMLQGAANPEFNNPGGFLLPIKDYGVYFGMLYWTLFGFAVASIFRSFKRREVMGLFLYPITFVALLELSRLMYLTDGRTFPSVVFLPIAVVLCSQVKSAGTLRVKPQPIRAIGPGGGARYGADPFPPAPQQQV